MVKQSATVRLFGAFVIKILIAEEKIDLGILL